MKSVTYSDAIRGVPEYLTLAEQTTRRLDEILTPSARRASAQWGLTADERGRPLVTLRLWDDLGEAQARLTPGEIKDPPSLRVRLLFLWDDVLKERMDKQLQALQGNGEGAGD